jgi:hypothetical protein
VTPRNLGGLVVSDKKKADPGVEPEKGGEGLDQVKRLVGLLLAASLGISVAFNIYVVAENVSVKSRLAEQEKMGARCDGLHQFSARLINELGFMARSQPAVGDLLSKYRPAIAMFELGSLGGGPSGGD